MATSFSNSQIKDFITQNALDPGAIDKAMKDYGVGFDDIKQAGGWSDDDVGNYVRDYGNADLQSSYSTWQAGRQPTIPTTIGTTPTGTTPGGPGTTTGTPTGTGTGTTSTGTSTGTTTTGTTTGGTGATSTGYIDPYAEREARMRAEAEAANKQNAFDPNSFAASMASWTQNLLAGLKPQPIQIQMPKAWEPTAAQLAGISAESRIPGLLSGATAKQAGELALGQSNARGLLNSSMAVQGANNAMIANAADIAGGDATRFGGLLQTQINNNAQMDRLGVQGQLNERQSSIDQGFKIDTLGANMMGEAMKFDAGNARDDFTYARGRGDLLTDRTDARGYEQGLYSRGRTDLLADREYADTRADALRNDATETALQTAYATEVDGVKDALNREVAAIQQSDLPPDVKQAQVQEAIGRAQVNVQLTNTLFQNLPKWKAEWSQLTLAV